MSETYPALQRGVIVLHGARGLYVIGRRNEGLRGQLTLEIYGIESGNVADKAGALHSVENHGTLTVPGWQLAIVPTPTEAHRAYADSVLGRLVMNGYPQVRASI